MDGDDEYITRLTIGGLTEILQEDKEEIESARSGTGFRENGRNYERERVRSVAVGVDADSGEEDIIGKEETDAISLLPSAMRKLNRTRCRERR